MDKNKKSLFLIVLLLIIFGFIWFFYTNNKNKHLTASGTIEATEIVVSSKIAGKISDIAINQGETVVKNQILATIEAAELEKALKIAQTKYNLAKNDFERNSKLYQDGIISAQLYDTLKSNIDVAYANLQIAQTQYDNATIRSPISGIVLVKAIEKGELASIGAPIGTLADLSKVNLIVFISEENIGKINLGEDVSVSVDSYPNEQFKGKIIYISDKAEFTPKSIQTKEERTNLVFAVKIEILNLDEKLKPGMPADAGFQWNTQ